LLKSNEEEILSKGYIIARITVIDPDRYSNYARETVKALRVHGGRALVRSGRYAKLEGEVRDRNVVLEFDSFEQAQNYYRSAEYQNAKMKRDGAAIADVIAVEGVD
jgi:uncharacterized protein (DUF1330 family)